MKSNIDQIIKKPYQKHSYKPHEIEELYKCANDPIYFCENYVYVQTTSEGRKLFKPYDFQKRFINQLTKYKYNIALMSRQMGKCVRGNTKIKVRNKLTGEILETTMEDFFNLIKEKSCKNQ